MRIAIEWQAYYGGLRIRRNPKCEMVVDKDQACGRAATVRVHNLPHWSLLWCSEHAREFDHERVTA